MKRGSLCYQDCDSRLGQRLEKIDGHLKSLIASRMSASERVHLGKAVAMLRECIDEVRDNQPKRLRIVRISKNAV